MPDVLMQTLHREAVYLWYYFAMQFQQLAVCWALGMSLGSATAFMITGPATKITNLGALKIVLGAKRFAVYLAVVMAFSLLAGVVVNLLPW